MSYQVSSPQNRTNKYSIVQSQPIRSIEHQSPEGSNSSGKKITFIKRKVSNPSVNGSSQIQQTKSQIVSQGKSNYKQEYQQYNQNQQMKGSQVIRHNNKSNPNIIIINDPHQQSLPSSKSQNNPSNFHQQHSSLSKITNQSQKQQQFEEQLQNIQQDVRFFAQRLQQAEQNNTKLHNLLQVNEHEIQSFVRNVYSFVNRLFYAQKQTLYEQMNTFLNSEDKIDFYNMVQKSSGTQSASISINQLEKDTLTLINILNLTLIDRNHLDQLLKSTQNTLNQNIKQISHLQHKNHALSHEHRLLEMEINEKAKIPPNATQIINIQRKSHQKQQLFNVWQKTSQQSPEYPVRDFNQKQRKHALTQTQQKRIGPAGSIHKYQTIRYEVIPNRNSPYKNYVKDRSISNDSKADNSLESTLQNELKNRPITRKTTYQKRIVIENTKKAAEKKKPPATSSYLNHLIQSEQFLNEQTPQPLQRNNRFQQQLDSSKSHISLRRPTLRNRSQSQQQVLSSRERTSSKNSINYTCSRVITTYSLNPVNQYGQKRLCNEMNSKRVRKITQLSEESDSLSERMKSLMEEEEMLKQKFRELEQVKVSRDSKISSQSNSKNSRMNQFTTVNKNI